MKEYFKEIKVNDDKDVSYNITGNLIPLHIIRTNASGPKSIKFCRWDDYSFESWYGIDYEKYKSLKNEFHTFEKDHLLYIPLLHLLNGEEELIIDDDETRELNKKYMKIFFSSDYIGIDFIYNFDEDPVISDKFSVFVKNIGFDLRSKIDCVEKDTKERLYFFFGEVFNLFDEEYHQMTIEEYLLGLDNLDINESKKYVKKFEKTNTY